MDYYSCRVWGILNILIFSVCLPVDILIFYTEPFGFVGTMIVLVAAFIPFMMMQAEAFYPEQEMWVIDRGKDRDMDLLDFIFRFLDGNYRKLLRNSWSKHFSISYNVKYNFICNATWIGYNFFSTLALVIYLLKVI